LGEEEKRKGGRKKGKEGEKGESCGKCREVFYLVVPVYMSSAFKRVMRPAGGGEGEPPVPLKFYFGTAVVGGRGEMPSS